MDSCFGACYGASSYMPEQPTEVVILSVQSDGGIILGEENIPLDHWYDDLHPLIDDPTERKARGVRSIEGTQVDSRGVVSKRWRVLYDADGKVEDSTELPIGD